MTSSASRWRAAFAFCACLLLVPDGAALAFGVRPKSGRFDARVIENPVGALDVATTPVSSLAAGEAVRAPWDAFRAAHGSAWSIYLDRRSGAPLLVEGEGIPWAAGKDATVDSLGKSLRAFIASNKAMLLADDSELVLDHEASGLLSPDVWQIAFNREIGGVPVAGERYVFTIGHGNLVSFGTPRWSRIDVGPIPAIDSAEALARMTAYMGLTTADGVELVDKGALQIIPLRDGPAKSPADGPYRGAIGSGYASALVWRLTLRVDGEPGTWEAQVDATSGAIVSFTDVNDYAQAKGGVYPVSDDQNPPDGVEQLNWPMPYADIASGTQQTASALGLFTCNGAHAVTTLTGPYVRVVDTCGPISQSVACDNDLDLGSSAGIDCAVPAGTAVDNLGDTHASRAGFYHLNRIAEHARVWLPSRTWLASQLTDNVNLNQTCNAYWNGSSVNFFQSGGGCNNSGEIAGVFLHEWGHGLDANDGGGSENPGEAYADVISFLSTHASCIGRGFFQSGFCSGYGDACLTCTGIRDQDFAQHLSGVPATPQDYVANHCGSGTGPCGREVHCEGHVGAEALWDLAARDLPASGLDAASSWQLADKLWYKSRLGSGGNAYNCALPSSDGCGATTWFTKLRAVDDDDGNLANGTPHAAAIYAAFNRHAIACGLATDAANQNSTACPSIGASTLTATAGSAAAQLTWTAVANATAYNVLRNDASCTAGSTIIATVPGTTFTDTNLADGFPEYYSVQAVRANAACDGPLSNCRGVTPQPFAGLVKLNAASYSCQATINVSVNDANIGGPTTTVKLTSAAEPSGETITLTQVAPGSVKYVGTIATTAAPAAADGLLSVAGGDTITATYVDANDGQGGVNVTRTTTATTDCIAPIISNVSANDITGNSAHIAWTTNESATSVVHYGLSGPPGSTASLGAQAMAHGLDLAGLAECSLYFYSVESADAVGNIALDDNAGADYAFATGKNANFNFASTDGPVPIPDNLPAGATSSIVITDNKLVQNVKVTLNLTHTFDRDLVITLIPPAGAPVTLSMRRGASGHNFVATVFDDAATASIAAGTAPFTGSFRPETPLAAVIGIDAAGTWQLHVVDTEANDVGTIDDWTLSLTYPTASCGPHASFQSQSRVADTCSLGGAGSGNGNWDAGELVNFKIDVANDGTGTLTNVVATITATTPGVVMVDGTANVPAIPAGTSADSIAPNFTAYLPANLPCGGTIGFHVAIASDQGSWSGSFTHGVGQPGLIVGTALNEDFAGGIPATWGVVDGGSGGGLASTWTTANPGGRTFSAPLGNPVAIVDSDFAGPISTVLQDEQLITPAMNLASAAAVTLEFDQYYLHYAFGLVEVADVDVKSSATGGAWVNLLEQSQTDSPNPDHQTIDISAEAAGAINVQVRFHYYNGHYDYWWEVDNVKVSYVANAPCNMPACASTPPGLAKPVADGSFGTAMKASRNDFAGTSLGVTWDVSTCTSSNHHVLYGNLANVAAAAVTGSVCSLGVSGAATWTGVPAGNLWFVVVGDNNGTIEGSWGKTTSGERGGASASGYCGTTGRDNASTCP
jgi:trimeric autotransporter adhesin